MRHGKSDWGDETIDDFDRPLNKRGRKAATAVGAYLQKQDRIPQLILCSASKRTTKTAKKLMKIFDPTPEIDQLSSLYLAPPNDILSLLKSVPEKIDHVLVIGHNPGLHSLAISLGSRDFPGPHEAAVWHFPTAAVAQFSLDIDQWADINRDSATLTDFITPKTLPG